MKDLILQACAFLKPRVTESNQGQVLKAGFAVRERRIALLAKGMSLKEAAAIDGQSRELTRQLTAALEAHPTRMTGVTIAELRQSVRLGSQRLGRLLRRQ